MSSRCGTTSTDRLRKLLSQLVDVLLPASIIIILLSFGVLFIQCYDVALLLRTVLRPLLLSLFRDAFIVVLMLFALPRWVLRPLLSRDAAVVMLVLSLLALLVGAGGVKVYNYVIWPIFLLVWFWLPLYPLMPILKGWYVSIVHSIYPSCQVDVMIVPWPFPSIGLWAVGIPVDLLGFQVPGVWMPFLVHIPYWLAVSYGLSALIHRYNKARSGDSPEGSDRGATLCKL